MEAITLPVNLISLLRTGDSLVLDSTFVQLMYSSMGLVRLSV